MERKIRIVPVTAERLRKERPRKPSAADLSEYHYTHLFDGCTRVEVRLKQVK